MSKPSSRFILKRLHRHLISSKPSSLSHPHADIPAISHNLYFQTKIKTPYMFSSQRSYKLPSFSKMLQNTGNKITPQSSSRSLLGFKEFSETELDLVNGNVYGKVVKNVVEKPIMAVKTTVLQYREAVRLQIEAFWKRNSLFLIGSGGVVVCIMLWRVMFGIADAFVGLSEGMAKYGFLVLSSAIVAFSGLYLRSRFVINPEKVYRMAMRRLNTSAGILEVMGALLTGTDLRAYVMSGGGITLKNFKAGLRSKRCFLIFPIRGSERRGLVSVEVKNKKGQYDMKLLAVDIPMAAGPDQRVFLVGDEEEYKIGGGLIAELRDLVVKAMSAVKEFEDRDDKEDEEDAERELLEAERKHREEIEKLERENSRYSYPYLNGTVLVQVQSSKKDNDCDDDHFSKEISRASNVSLITDRNQWDEKLSKADEAGKIVLVNFSASWCGPCGDILPLFCSLAKKYPSMMFLVVDVDELAEFSTSWEIKATPTFFFLKHGREVDKLVGANKEELQRMTEIMARPLFR